MDAEIILIIIKMLLGGIVAFLAILIMSKTRASSWMFMMCGFLFMYISLMFELFVSIGVFKEPPIYIFGLPLFSLLSMVIPNLFFSIGLIIKLIKK